MISMEACQASGMVRRRTFFQSNEPVASGQAARWTARQATSMPNLMAMNPLVLGGRVVVVTAVGAGTSHSL